MCACLCSYLYGAVTSAVLAVTTISKMIVTTLTVSSITNQSASLCSCPAGNGKVISKYSVCSGIILIHI